MPRRKQLTFHIQDLRCAGHIIEELSQLPQLANFDMNSIELTIKENRPAPKIVKKDIDILIDRLQRGFSANKHTVTQLNGCYLITNVHLAKWMKSKHSVKHVFFLPTSVINFAPKKRSYDDTRRSGRDNELLQRAQSDLQVKTGGTQHPGMAVL